MDEGVNSGGGGMGCVAANVSCPTLPWFLAERTAKRVSYRHYVPHSFSQSWLGAPIVHAAAASFWLLFHPAGAFPPSSLHLPCSQKLLLLSPCPPFPWAGLHLDQSISLVFFPPTHPSSLYDTVATAYASKFHTGIYVEIKCSDGWGVSRRAVGGEKEEEDGWMAWGPAWSKSDTIGWGESSNPYSVISTWKKGSLSFSSLPPLKGVKNSVINMWQSAFGFIQVFLEWQSEEVRTFSDLQSLNARLTDLD